jgi:hypothetical protein
MLLAAGNSADLPASRTTYLNRSGRSKLPSYSRDRRCTVASAGGRPRFVFYGEPHSHRLFDPVTRAHYRGQQKLVPSSMQTDRGRIDICIASAETAAADPAQGCHILEWCISYDTFPTAAFQLQHLMPTQAQFKSLSY